MRTKKQCAFVTPKATEEYRSPMSSSLEEYRSDIAEFRMNKWPYREIRDWLKATHGKTVHHSTVASFCEVREIKKGVGETKMQSRVVLEPKKKNKGAVSANSLDRDSHTRKKLDGDDFDFGA